jgi:hypothetical protein
MLVALAILFGLAGSPNVSFYDVTSGGPSFVSAPAAASVDDAGSGGPSLNAAIEPPSPDAGSGGPSHP